MRRRKQKIGNFTNKRVVSRRSSSKENGKLSLDETHSRIEIIDVIKPSSHLLIPRKEFTICQNACVCKTGAEDVTCEGIGKGINMGKEEEEEEKEEGKEKWKDVIRMN